VAKIVVFFFLALACVQLIKPLGWRGLEHRRDAWKLAVLGFILSVVAIAFSTGIQPN